MKTLFSILLSTVFCTLLLPAQTYEFNGRPVNGAARTASLGGAAVGEAYDVNTMYWNPAALSFLRFSSVTVSSILDRNGRSFDNTVTLPAYQIDHQQMIAAGIAASVYGDPWSEPFFAYHGIDVGYSYKLHHTFSIGALMNIRYGTTSFSGLWAGSGAIGAYYAPSPGISYGISYDGIGLGVLYTNYGSGGELKYQRKLGQSLRIGSSFRFPSLYRMPYVILSLESQKYLEQSGIIYRGGIETFPSTYISLRLGIIASRIATAGSIGIGVHIDALRMDYAYSPDRFAKRFHQISIAYQIGS